MKKYFITIVIVALTCTSFNAQIKKITPTLPDNVNLSADLDLDKIKNHITSGEFCYEINLSSTVIIPPKYPKKLAAIDAYYNTTKYVEVERTYLRSNGLLLRSDKNFNRINGNSYEVLIYPDRYDRKKIDKNQVKITWNTPERGLKTFLLKNVSIQYKPYGILIIGDYEIEGVIFGVNIGLIPTTCLI